VTPLLMTPLFMTPWLFVGTAVAGGIGAGLRYLVDLLVVGTKPARFPLGILVVNVTGSFALGVLTGLGAAHVGSETAWLLGVGLLGGYTTFSTVSAESVLLMRTGETRRGWVNAAGTLVAGVAAAGIGLALGGLF
jgi:CrcB protein